MKGWCARFENCWIHIVGYKYYALSAKCIRLCRLWKYLVFRIVDINLIWNISFENLVEAFYSHVNWTLQPNVRTSSFARTCRFLGYCNQSFKFAANARACLGSYKMSFADFANKNRFLKSVIQICNQMQEAVWVPAKYHLQEPASSCNQSFWSLLKNAI